jgi:hypothetical protein
MNTEYSLDGFLEAVDFLCDSQTGVEKVDNVAFAEKEIVNAPQLDGSIFSNFRLLMKSSPRNKDGAKTTECKKCDLTRKRLEEKMEKIEAALLFQQDQLFESYSNLKVRITILEEREQKRLKTNGPV